MNNIVLYNIKPKIKKKARQAGMDGKYVDTILYYLKKGNTKREVNQIIRK